MGHTRLRQYFSDLDSHKSLWLLAWPMMLSNISQPLLGAVDTAILGHLESATYLAAVAVGASILTFIFWALGFLRMGSTALIGRAFGEKNFSLCRQVLAQNLLLAVALALLLIATQWLWLPLALLPMLGDLSIRPIPSFYNNNINNGIYYCK